MRLAALVLLFAASIAAADTPPGRLVRVLAMDNHYVTGNTVPAQRLLTILFFNEPCPLHIAGAENMHRAWSRLSAFPLGCWYATGEVVPSYVFVDGQGKLLNGIDPLLLPGARLQPDGSAIITQPGYDSEKTPGEVAQRRAAQYTEAMRHPPAP